MVHDSRYILYPALMTAGSVTCTLIGNCQLKTFDLVGADIGLLSTALLTIKQLYQSSSNISQFLA